MKYDVFFDLAKKAGIEDAELYVGTSTEMEISLFHSEIDKYSMNSSTSIIARGLVRGKIGAAACDAWSKEKAAYLVDAIVKNAAVIENDDPQFIFEGSPKYKKVSTYNKAFESVSVDEKLAKLYELEKKIKARDARISEVDTVEYSEKTEVLSLMNSKGLHLTQKSNYFVYVGSAVAKQDQMVKTGFDLFLGNNFSEFDVDALAERVADNALSQLGGEACDSSTYRAVLSPDVVASLTACYLSSADAEEVQKKSSLFMGKLNQKVASSKVTIEDRPLDKTLFAKSFDDEGVATYNKPIIKNGILQTYLYNLTTAAKDGVKSTGNADRGVGKIGVSPIFLKMKPGALSQEELFRKIGNGVYITEVQGLHSGMNTQSGNFSLQSTGFLIKDGKKDRALDIITVSGNLVNIFEDIVYVGNDVKVFPSGIACPSVQIKKLAVSGK